MKTTSVPKQVGDNDRTKKVEGSLLKKYIDRADFVWYAIGVIVRIGSTLVYPQKGYIHPDEFFQGPEIVFDDLFQTNFTRTHEFHPSAPLRSVGILYLLYALPVSMLASLSSLLRWSSVPFDLKLMFPRMTILFFSLWADLLFYRLIKFFYPKFNSKQHGILMNYYGIAHVTLIFFTRTLSNSVEAFLFLTLIYLVNINLSAIVINEKHRLITRHLMFTSASIGLICALGLFNRPTFPAFALVPIVYWCVNIIPTIGHSSQHHLFLSRIISFIIGAFLITSGSLILFDSYYYSNGFSFLIDLKNRLIICPLNFILYNVDSTNLDKHGLHPPWLHFIVNANILYGPLHLAVVIWGFTQIVRVKTAQRNPLEEQSISPLLLCLYLIPFIPLSTFPHQEARFLLPLIFPLILFIVPQLIRRNLHHSIFRLWLIFNILLAVIYGYVHQAGLLPALRYVHNTPANAQSAAINTNKKILVTYHTYMPPGYLATSMTKSVAEEKIQTIIIDLQGAKREELELSIERIFNEYSLSNLQVFVILPNTCRTDLIYLKQRNYSFHLLKQFGPHLDLDHGFDEPFHVKYAGTNYQWLRSMWAKHRLDLYEVTRG